MLREFYYLVMRAIRVLFDEEFEQRWPINEKIKDALICLGRTALIVGAIRFIYVFTGIEFVKSLMPLALLYPLRYYWGRKRRGKICDKAKNPTRPGNWICRNCGIENNAIYLECFSCKERRLENS